MSQAAEEALSKAEAAAEEVAKAERQAAKEAAMSRLQEQLAAGDEPRRLRQALSPRVFVIDFDTRPPARQGSGPPRPAPSNRALLDDLRETVSLLLHVATPFDEVVLRVTSPGGPVTDYGLAAAQFGRLKAAGVKTTACVDLVAASGGYMIACAADKILAAPFSIVGSIGVVAGVPNVHRLLERGGVEYVQRTAGNFKRTINIFTPNTEEGLKKFDEELQLVHTAFMAHVGEHRKERLTRSLEDVCLRCVAEVRAALARLHALTPGLHPAHLAHLAHLAPLAPLVRPRRCAPTSRSSCARCASRASRASPASRPPSRRRPSVCSRPRCVSPWHVSPQYASSQPVSPAHAARGRL